jgi:hypothetical protein
MEKSVENMVPLKGLPFNSSMISFHISKNTYIHCKSMFICWVSLFCNVSTFGPMAQATLKVRTQHMSHDIDTFANYQKCEEVWKQGAT